VNAKNPSSCPAKSTTTRGVAFTAASASALALVVALALASAPAERRIASDARANVEPLAVDIAIDRRGVFAIAVARARRNPARVAVVVVVAISQFRRPCGAVGVVFRDDGSVPHSTPI